MKLLIPFLSFIVVLTSCTTAYKSAQTPDDVYYSPARPQDEYVRVEQNNTRRSRNQSDDEYYDDRYLRMKVNNRQVWSDLDYYYSNPYAYRYYNNFYSPNNYNNYWNPYSYWNNYYNPYGTKVIVVNPSSPVYNKPRMSNLNVYDNPNNSSSKNNRSRSNSYSNSYGNSSDRNNSSSPRDNGSDLRNVFGNNSSSNNNSSRSSDASSTRSSSPTNSSSNSNSSSSNAPVRKF